MSENTRTPWYRKKNVLILLVLLFAIIVFGSTTQTWLQVQADQGVVKAADMAVQGSKAATAVTAFSVVAIAGALAASISGRVIRIAAGCVLLLASIGIAVAVLTVLANPQAAASGPVGAQIGVTGIPLQVTLSPIIWLSLGADVLLFLGAVAVLLFGRAWTGTKKYENSTAGGAKVSDEPVDDIDSWDRLSRGDDPTSGTIEDDSASHSNQENP
ncbi:putative membrane protein (TIGR02234 family) [Psychromicrobium silvestre]|uniref:Putative membrane protein (TIGR02234 family) n=1 Tax=Psychromicrobium silvestre TaxID=1645614 RepID=A0A7Y9S3Y6_9MICC|nr:Trp biosynthesis-associated membrane protein [Psychromicrobium silvestre]NYE94114.1 putative membrane protein (TIGR02234 family) [Psychromicrobium silvestre]